jgi:cephalosporin-C deacetylase
VAHFDLPLDQLRSYAPRVQEPDDFDAFWADTLAQARGAGGTVESAPVEAALPHVDVVDLSFPGFGGHPVKAWYSRPAGVSQPLPTVVQFQGYGGGRGLPFEHTFWPAAGLAHLMMDTRGQGSTWGGGGDTPDPGGSAPAVPGYMTRGILEPSEYYYRRLMTDAVRAVDAARSLPGVDPGRVFVAGGSQGGGLAIAAAALVPDLAGVMADVPFLCHYERALAVTDADPYGEVRRYLAVHREHVGQVFSTLAYFDGVSLARRAQAPALFSVALMDETCPPSTVFAAFNAYGERSGVTDKDITVYPFNGHEGGGPHQAARQWEFVRRIAG